MTRAVPFWYGFIRNTSCLLQEKTGKSDFPAFSVPLQACFKETELFPQAVFFLLGAKGRLDGVILEPHEVLHGPIVLPGHFGKLLTKYRW